MKAAAACGRASSAVSASVGVVTRLVMAISSVVDQARSAASAGRGQAAGALGGGCTLLHWPTGGGPTGSNSGCAARARHGCGGGARGRTLRLQEISGQTVIDDERPHRSAPVRARRRPAPPPPATSG